MHHPRRYRFRNTGTHLARIDATVTSALTPYRTHYGTLHDCTALYTVAGTVAMEAAIACRAVATVLRSVESVGRRNITCLSAFDWTVHQEEEFL